jgi:hypothetical protein
MKLVDDPWGRLHSQGSYIFLPLTNVLSQSPNLATSGWYRSSTLGPTSVVVWKGEGREVNGPLGANAVSQFLISCNFKLLQLCLVTAAPHIAYMKNEMK